MLLDGDLAERYRDFADFAEEDSPCLADWSRRMAEDPDVHAWLAGLDRRGQQPNLVLAAARWHGAPAPGPYAELKRLLVDREDDVKRTIASRATQTNEVGRLATLVPVLAMLPQPLALVEVGASAGLCLYPDRYDYAWTGAGSLRGSGGPELACVTAGDLPVPDSHPEVAWRGGCDLNPLDVSDEDQMAWLEVLVWPEQAQRRARLRSAVEIARAEPPHVVRGDLLERLPDLLAEAGRHGTPVVFHSAVAAYLEIERRQELAEVMTRLVRAGRCHWISNEAPHVLPEIPGARDVPPARFVLGLDGTAVAFTHGHGRAIEWL